MNSPTENKNTQPLLGLDWLGKLEIGLQGNKNTNSIRNVNRDERSENNLKDYEDLLKKIHTIKGLTIDIQLREDANPIQQKGRPVPIHSLLKYSATRTRKTKLKETS